MKSPNAIALRSVEDLADAKQLRSVISSILATAPMKEDALRCAVWSFVGGERSAAVPPALVITKTDRPRRRRKMSSGLQSAVS